MPDQLLPLAELEVLDRDARRARRRAREDAWRAGASKHPKICSSCRQAIRWALTESSPPKWMPVDPKPQDDGTVAIARDGAAVMAMVNAPPEIPGPRYRSHWATCTSAGVHRRSS